MEGVGMMDMYALLMGGGGGGGGGSDSSVVVVHEVDETLDKTWKEIFDAMAAGKLVIVPFSINDEYPMVTTYVLTEAMFDPDENDYRVYFQEWGNMFYFVTDTPNGYPVLADD